MFLDYKSSTFKVVFCWMKDSFQFYSTLWFSKVSIHRISYNPIITPLLFFFKVVNLCVYSCSFCLCCLTYMAGFLWSRNIRNRKELSLKELRIALFWENYSRELISYRGVNKISLFMVHISWTGSFHWSKVNWHL